MKNLLIIFQILVFSSSKFSCIPTVWLNSYSNGTYFEGDLQESCSRIWKFCWARQLKWRPESGWRTSWTSFTISWHSRTDDNWPSTTKPSESAVLPWPYRTADSCSTTIRPYRTAYNWSRTIWPFRIADNCLTTSGPKNRWQLFYNPFTWLSRTADNSTTSWYSRPADICSTTAWPSTTADNLSKSSWISSRTPITVLQAVGLLMDHLLTVLQAAELYRVMADLLDFLWFTADASVGN